MLTLNLEAVSAHARDVPLHELAALLVRRVARLQEARVPRRLGLRARATPVRRARQPAARAYSMGRAKGRGGKK